MRWGYPPIQIRDVRGEFARPIEALRATPWPGARPKRPPVAARSRPLWLCFAFLSVAWPIGMVTWAVVFVITDIRSDFNPPPRSVVREFFFSFGLAAYLSVWMLWVRHWWKVGAQRSAEIVARRGTCPSCGTNLAALQSNPAKLPCPNCGMVWDLGPASGAS